MTYVHTDSPLRPVAQDYLDLRIAERKVLDEGCSVRQAAQQGLEGAKKALTAVRGGREGGEGKRGSGPGQRLQRTAGGSAGARGG